MNESSEAGMNRALIGKVYEGAPATLSAEEIRAFAEATNDPHPMYFAESAPEGAVAPPLLPVKYCNRIYLTIFRDTELRVNFARLLFGEMEMRFFGLLRPGEHVRATAQISDIEDKDSGQILRVVTRVFSGEEPRCEATAGFFVRSLTARPKGQRPAPPHADMPPVAFEEAMVIREDQPNLFAKAADDPNPIHVDDDFARSVGLPGRILHGLCTMAFTSRAFVQRACGGDPRKLRRLKVRFSKPALPGQTVVTRAFEPEKTASAWFYRFVALTGPNDLVITNGEAEVER